jgi:hypothetical protein
LYCTTTLTVDALDVLRSGDTFEPSAKAAVVVATISSKINANLFIENLIAKLIESPIGTPAIVHALACSRSPLSVQSQAQNERPVAQH